MAHIGSVGVYNSTQTDEDLELQLALALSASEAAAHSQHGSAGQRAPATASSAGQPSMPSRKFSSLMDSVTRAADSVGRAAADSMGKAAKSLQGTFSQPSDGRGSGAVAASWSTPAAQGSQGYNGAAAWQGMLAGRPSGAAASIPPRPANGLSDEELARQLQLQYDAETAAAAAPGAAGAAASIPPPRVDNSPGWSRGGHPSAPAPAATPTSTSQDQCAGCKRHFWFGDGMSRLLAMGQSWHTSCFVCEVCKQPLGGGGSSFVVGSDSKPYHSECHRRRWTPACKVCGDFVPTQGNGRMVWQEHPFWKEKYCPQHGEDGTPRCCSCQRLQSHKEQWATMADGRHLCYVCMATVVTDTQDCQPLYREILDFFSKMGLHLPSVPPLSLVDGYALNDATERSGMGRSREGPVFHTRGICMAEEQITYTTSALGRAFGSMGARPERVQIGPTRTRVTAILVMQGLPRLLTGSIIAHELMHAHFRLNGFGRMSADVEEGLCQLMAYLWLDQQQLPNGSADERLASFFAHQIRQDTSVVYGDGFRAAFESFQKFGLYRVLTHVKSTHTLPQ